MQGVGAWLEGPPLVAGVFMPFERESDPRCVTHYCFEMTRILALSFAFHWSWPPPLLASWR
jgi:hypothetical protein